MDFLASFVSQSLSQLWYLGAVTMRLMYCVFLVCFDENLISSVLVYNERM